MVCLGGVALALLAIPTVVWLVTYFGENRMPSLEITRFVPHGWKIPTTRDVNSAPLRGVRDLSM